MNAYKLEILGALLTATRNLIGGTDLMGLDHRGAELGRSDRLVDEVRKYLDAFDRLAEAETSVSQMVTTCRALEQVLVLARLCNDPPLLGHLTLAMVRARDALTPAERAEVNKP
jgi:hypothetical protein